MRHNRIRDMEADLMREVCHNVQVEPELLPIDSDRLSTGSNTAEKARLDVSGDGVWKHANAHEKSFLDIRIMHPNAPSYVNKPIEQRMQEGEIRGYTTNELCLSKEDNLRQLLDPPSDEWETKRINNTRELLISEKRKENYADKLY